MKEDTTIRTNFPGFFSYFSLKLIVSRSSMKHTSNSFGMLFIGFLLLIPTMVQSCKNPGDGRTSLLILTDETVPQLSFAAGEMNGSLDPALYRIDVKGIEEEYDRNTSLVIFLGSLDDDRFETRIPVSLKSKISGSQPEGFQIIKEGNQYWVAGSDPAGAMYGGLELAELIRIYGLKGINDMKSDPYMRMRGVKFNIPLDARTPSYSDLSDAAQKNMAEMWSMEFWKEYIDQLARFRYNFISLWNLHPFPSLVSVPDYPEVALEDVWQSEGPWNENYDLNGTGFDEPPILEHTKVLKQMTMDEKIAFWREVMAYGKSRNIDFYVVTWNIFDYGTGGKYGITDDIDNEVTVDYFRKSVKQLFLTYPDLAGIGLTTGENMGESSSEKKEEWAFRTYAKGVMDASAEQPGRNIIFLHRQHQTGALDIAERFSPLIDHENIRFLFSFKYAKAHVFSSVHQPFSEDFVKEIKGMKTIWTLRNDDNYYFRWGGAGFVRDFIRNIPYEVSEGFYYGSDQWVWGREFLSRSPDQPRQLEVKKHWYHWMLWGRFGYDPNLSDGRLVGLLEDHFPGVDGKLLFDSWQSASMIYPKTTGFHWGALDFQWYIEGCKSRPGPARTETGFHDVNRFITLAPHPGTDDQSIPDYAEMIREGGTSNLRSPLKVALEIHHAADSALFILEMLDPGDNAELTATLSDIRSMALLGKYYAHKIEGATFLHLAREGIRPSADDRKAAVDHLEKASGYWKLYMENALEQYRNPLWTNRVGYVDLQQIYQWVLEDILIARDTN